jgi:tetratricopeptide (TPR) repeat protein
MNKSILSIILLAVSLATSNAVAQSKLGLQMIHDERWLSAEKEFAKSTADEDVFYKGFVQMKQENIEAAKTSFNSIATKPYGKIGLGMLELNAKNKEGATKLFEAAANETKNKNPEIFVAISRAIANSTADEKDDAIMWAKKASDMAKTNAEYRIVWGDACLSTQDGGSANTQYEYAQQYAPNTALPFAKIGRVYYRMKVYKEALPNLKKALELDPNNALALYYLAQIYDKYKVYDTAEMYQQKLIQIGDKNLDDMVVLANIYFKAKNYEKAIEQISEIIKGDNKYNHLNRLIGYSYYETGKHQEAITFLEKFLETQPKEKIVASDYEYLGKAYIAQGDKEKGVVTMRKAVEMNPADKDAAKSIAEAFKKAKMPAEELEFYKKVAELPEPTATDFLNVGLAMYKNKLFEESDATFTKVIELSPNTADAYYMKGKCKMYTSTLDQTMAPAKEDFAMYLEKVVGNEEKNKKKVVEAKIYMAKVAIVNEKDIAKAKVLLDEVIILDPENKDAMELMEHTK